MELFGAREGRLPGNLKVELQTKRPQRLGFEPRLPAPRKEWAVHPADHAE